MLTIKSDNDGPRPEELDRAILSRPDIKCLFVIPRAHNPTTRSIGRARIGQLSEIAAKHSISVIEDDSYIGPRISEKNPTFASTYPTGTFYLSGFSKILQPGLRIAYLVPPKGSVSACQAIAQSLNYSVSPLLLELTRLWIADGTALKVYNNNKRFFQARQKLAKQILADLECSANEDNAQIWLQLPEPWTSVSFAETARSEGIRISAEESFIAAGTTTALRHVRLCVGSVNNDEEFVIALKQIRSLAQSEARFVQYDP